MRKPHVSVLIYHLEMDETVAFHDPPPLEQETDAFHMRLADGVLRFEMKEHHASEQSARNRVWPHIRSWELWNALDLGRRALWFTFEKSEIVDLDPPPPLPPGVIEIKRAIEINTAEMVTVGFEGTARLTDRRPQYPELPAGFVASPDVEMMWIRYELYRAGSDRITTMANMCLTVLQASAETWAAGRTNREKAANKYGISESVLKTLGKLASEVGDVQTARKVPKDRKFRPHAPAEIAWVEAVVRRLILRVGEWAFDPDARLPKLTMADFPKLP